MSKEPEVTASVHAQSEDGTHLVGVGNLRVVLVDDGDSWFAQGLEIDYFAQGDSVEDVQSRFEDGLAATIREHLKLHNSIKGILRVAPESVWGQFFSQQHVQKLHSQLTEYAPFEGIDYFQAAA